MDAMIGDATLREKPEKWKCLGRVKPQSLEPREILAHNTG